MACLIEVSTNCYFWFMKQIACLFIRMTGTVDDIVDTIDTVDTTDTGHVHSRDGSRL